MNIEFIMKVAGIGFVVAVCAQVLSKTGRDDQATLLGVAGVIVVLLMLLGGISDLIETVREVFLI